MDNVEEKENYWSVVLEEVREIRTCQKEGVHFRQRPPGFVYSQSWEDELCGRWADMIMQVCVVIF